MKNHVYVFLLIKTLLLLLPAEASSGETTYPEEVHQLVLERLNKIKGNDEGGKWGDWSPWTPCSRSCGTGVSTQRRECLPIRNKLENIPKKEEPSRLSCVGRSKRFQLCNTQICPEGLVDFRGVQCASFNKTPFNNRIYTWEPFIDSSASCTLNCRAVGLSFYATLNQSVVDGTPCGAFLPKAKLKLDRFCVEGSCMKVGCDGLLGSGRVIDSCGICGGDNTSCRVISGVYTRPKLPYGYNLIATLPPGATNLSIHHLKPSNNYLALRELGGNYILNGPSGLNSSGSFEASGTMFTYSRPNAHGGDHLYAKGPTLHSLDIMLFFQNTNPGIRYEYRLPMSSGTVLSFQSRPRKTITRRPNLPFHGTVQQSSSNHRFGHARDPVESYYKPNVYYSSPQLLADDPSYIDSVVNPLFGFNSSYLLSKENNLPGYSFQPSGYPYDKDFNLTFNLKPHKPAVMSKFADSTDFNTNNNYRSNFPSSLHDSSHSQAWQQRSFAYPFGKSHYLQSIDTNYNTHKSKLNSQPINSYQFSHQQPQLKPKFQNAYINNNQIIPPVSSLLANHDFRNKIRTNQLPRSFSPNSIFYQHSKPKFHAGSKKTELQFLEKKHQREWNIFEKGEKNSNKKPKILSQEKPKKKNDSKKAQKSKNKNRFVWEAKGFTKCSVPCGGGTQTSRIVCTKRRKKGFIVPPHFCAKVPPPKQQILTCNLKPCPPKWEATSWSECTVTCGIGIQFRKFICKQKFSPEKEIILSGEECGEVSSLQTTQVCQMKDCDSPPSWDIGPWSNCSSNCGLGTRRRNVSCTNPNGSVSEKYCKETKPSQEEACDMGSCATNTWFFSAWDETCQGPCGYATQRRRIHCSSGGEEANTFSPLSSSSSCSKREKPQEERRCTSSKQCGGSWFAGPWNDCDTQCGIGRQHRAVVCVLWRRGRYKVAQNEDDCKGAGERPEDSKPCTVDCQPQWFISEWSKCSMSCDGGIQRREIKCLNHNSEQSIECPSSTKPDSRQYCNTQPCNLKDYQSKNEVISFLPNEPNFESKGKNFDKNYAYLEQSEASFIQSPAADESSDPRRNSPKERQNSSKEILSQETFDSASKDELEDDLKLHFSKRFKSEEDTVKEYQNTKDLIEPGVPKLSDACLDRMKNCFLVYKARLCKLKYYNKLCCKTCLTQL